MTQFNNTAQDKTLVKFLVPHTLKSSIQKQAQDRNISLSSYLRLIVTQYIKQHSL